MTIGRKIDDLGNTVKTPLMTVMTKTAVPVIAAAISAIAAVASASASAAMMDQKSTTRMTPGARILDTKIDHVHQGRIVTAAIDDGGEEKDSYRHTPPEALRPHQKMQETLTQGPHPDSNGPAKEAPPSPRQPPPPNPTL